MLGSWGLGKDELAGVSVDVVEVVVVVVVVVVGVVRRHLLDAGGGAPHRLHVRLRGRPAPSPPAFVPPSLPGSHAPSRLFSWVLGALGALALALGPLSSPLLVTRVPPPVPHALARPLAHRPSPRPLHLGSLPAPLRALPVPWSYSVFFFCFFCFFQATILQLPRIFVKDDAQAADAAGGPAEAAGARPAKPVAARLELEGEKRLPEELP